MRGCWFSYYWPTSEAQLFHWNVGTGARVRPFLRFSLCGVVCDVIKLLNANRKRQLELSGGADISSIAVKSEQQQPQRSPNSNSNLLVPEKPHSLWSFSLVQFVLFVSTCVSSEELTKHLLSVVVLRKTNPEVSTVCPRWQR